MSATSTTQHTSVVVIGAGHAGLAMSRRLADRSIDHVVLERGEAGHAWRSQRWDSLRLLTPNWHVELPGAAPHAHDPDGFMAAADVADYVQRYAGVIDAPLCERTRVIRMRRGGDRYEVVTDRGTWIADAVVIATGGAVVTSVPPVAAALPASVESVPALTYRNPDLLPDGGVLVVGASATGVQLAEEIHGSGRPVTLAVGEHVRMPRTYRDRDIFWWLERSGVLDERFDELDDLTRARHLPSPQLVGSAPARALDLNRLRSVGVGLVGRLGRIRDGVAQFSGGLTNVCALADLKLDRLLRRLDESADTLGLESMIGPPERPEPTVVGSPHGEIDLVRAGIGSVVWATGFRPDHAFVDLAVFDHRGRIRHHGGVVDGAPGLYVLGLSLLRRRRSSYIAGAAGDTADLAEHLHRHLDRLVAARRSHRASMLVGAASC